MKRIMTLAIFCLAAAAGFASGSTEPDADGWLEFPRLRDFEDVELRIHADLTLIPGAECRVRAKGDPRDLDDLDVYVAGDALIIKKESLFSFLSPESPLLIEVTLPRLSLAKNTGSGSIRGAGRFESQDLELLTTGSGSISVEAIADALICKTTGSGSIEYRGRADSLELKCTGSGDADLEIRTNLAEIDLTGSGNAGLRGRAERMVAAITGSGRLLAGDFLVRDAEVSLTGSGDAEVRVSGALEARTSGSGSVFYSGSPESLDFQGSGSGKMLKR
jgi:hypothetical protein